MVKLIRDNSIRFILLVLFQILVLNNIHLSSYVTPFIYILFIIMLPSNINNLLALVLSFALGFSVDLLSGEGMGFHMFASTLIGFLHFFFIRLTVSRADIESQFTPSIKSMGVKNFLIYAIFMVVAHHFTFFSIEIFNISEIGQIFVRTILSSFCTLFLIMAIQFLLVPRKK